MLYILDLFKTPNISFKVLFKPGEVLRKYMRLPTPLHPPSFLTHLPLQPILYLFSIFVLPSRQRRKSNFQIFQTMQNGFYKSRQI